MNPRFLQGSQSTATRQDKAWFDAHPERNWRVRRVLPGEMEPLVRDPFHDQPSEAAMMYAHLTRYAMSPEAPTNTEMRLCVIQLQDGVRVRVPALYDRRAARFLLVRPDGSQVTPDALVEFFRETFQQDGALERDFGEVCKSCQTVFRTSDTCVLFKTASVDPDTFCLGCALPVLKGGRVPCGLSVFVSKEKGEELTEATIARIGAAMNRVQQIAAHPETLVDAVAALLAELERV